MQKTSPALCGENVRRSPERRFMAKRSQKYKRFSVLSPVLFCSRYIDGKNLSSVICFRLRLTRISINQRANGPVNAHLISGLL